MNTLSASVPDPHAERIAALNDEFRKTLADGYPVLTYGVLALGPEKAAAVLEEVRAFDAFENDPHDRHNFGSFAFEGHTFFWKIDYYDAPFAYHAEDAAATTTGRVLTVMLADEY